MKQTNLIFFLVGLGAALLALFVASCGGSATPVAYVTIGTGGVTGVYYPTGQAIARMINTQQDTYHIKASAESTGGSVYNINAILSGDLDFGIAQSDRGYQAYHGLADWRGNPAVRLRSVFSLHSEIVTLVAADDSGISSLIDIKGKTVNIGNPGSGHRGNALDIFQTAGIDIANDITAESLKAAEAPKMLQDGRIDAFFYTVGHPNGAINEATAGKRKVHFVPIIGVETLRTEFPYYAEAMISGALYPQASNQTNVPSVGVVTMFLTSDAVPDDVVYAVVKEVVGNLDTFRATHPALNRLTPEGMLKGLTSPLHPGAKKYFREQGYLP